MFTSHSVQSKTVMPVVNVSLSNSFTIFFLIVYINFRHFLCCFCHLTDNAHIKVCCIIKYIMRPANVNLQKLNAYHLSVILS